MHARTFDHPERYSFVDVAQNSHQRGQAQWDNLQWLRERLADRPRPINSVKMYGGNHGGGPIEGQHKLWRQILGGGATARYHRPGGGIGLNAVTAAHLRSLSLALERVDIFAVEPAGQWLVDAEPDSAYLAARAGSQYLLYMPHGGAAKLDLRGVKGHLRLQWLQVLTARWAEQTTVTGGAVVRLTPPATAGEPAVMPADVAASVSGNGPWAAVLLR
jgi:hypothetical protein